MFSTDRQDKNVVIRHFPRDSYATQGIDIFHMNGPNSPNPYLNKIESALPCFEKRKYDSFRNLEAKVKPE